MRLFKREVNFKGVVTAIAKAFPPTALSPVSSLGGWWPIVREPFTGAWQRNISIDQQTVAAYWAVFSCVTLIASDISKMAPWVMERNEATGVFKRTLLRPVLRKPNRFQTRVEFYSHWLFSKLLRGNTYVLKQRDESGNVEALYILHPDRVVTLVAPDGSVFYQLQKDDLAGLPEGDVAVPASEIIHDKMYTLYHPLVGVSPIYACGIPAMQGSAIQNNSERFFANMSRPSGILTAPGAISNETADRLKTKWEENFSGGNIGKVAVLGDNLKYEPMSVTPVDAQLIEQLKMTAEMVCACFHVPGYKIGVGQMPASMNTGVLNQQYYDQCLSWIIETMEERLDEGLELNTLRFEIWFDIMALLRMDPSARYTAHNDAIKGGWKKPNEARIEEDMDPVTGGDTPYMQQQNFSLAALDRRDKSEDPFAKTGAGGGTPATQQNDNGTMANMIAEAIVKAARELQQAPQPQALTVLAATEETSEDEEFYDALIAGLQNDEPSA